jgi:predicted N-acetyltransferase YhbS
MFEIQYLADGPQHIPALAAWHYAQWGELNPANDAAARIERFQKHLQKSAIPTTFVACNGDELLGSASLVTSDLDMRPQLTPWLASVFVAPAARNQGVGAAIVQRVMAEARAVGVPRLHLFTLDREAFYTRLGWQLLERAIYRDHEIAIMAVDFSNS